MRRFCIAAFACVVLLAGCGGSSSSPVQPSGGAPSAEARAYLDELIGVMQANSINRLKIDWASFRAAVYATAGASQTVYSAVASGVPVALRLLGDHHSLYLTSQGTYIYNPDPPPPCSDSPGWPAVSVPQSIGYIKVGAFAGQDAGMAAQFAVSIQERIRATDSDTLTGWIVDLRGNGGGNMYPMIAGIGPVLGEGLAGAFVSPTGATDGRWGYTDGAAWLEDSSGGSPGPITRVPAPYQPMRPNPKVAVLTNCWVGSSGEAVVVAFRGRPNTRSFGTPTGGISTANRGFWLSDGGTLLLTVSTMADRQLTVYGKAIRPDEEIADPTTAVTRAVQWLHER